MYVAIFRTFYLAQKKTNGANRRLYMKNEYKNLTSMKSWLFFQSNQRRHGSKILSQNFVFSIIEL